MGKLIGVVFVIVGIMVCIYMFPTMMDSLHDLRTNDQTDAFSVDTGGGVTNSSVTLSQDLWEGGTEYVDSVTSDLGTDNPVTNTYTSATNALLIEGLTASASRNLTVIYGIAALDEYSGMEEFTGLAPLIIFVIILGIAGAAIWRSFSGGPG